MRRMLWPYAHPPSCLKQQPRLSIPRVPFFASHLCHDGPQLAALDRRCAAAEAATTALVVATRAAVDRPGPGHVYAPLLTRTEDGQGRGGGSRVALHGGVPDASSSPGGRHSVLCYGRG